MSAKFAPCDHSARAEKLLTLKPNWDSYGAAPIATAAIEAALGALRTAALVPTSEGGVSVELRAEDCEVQLAWSPAGNLKSALMEWDRELEGEP